MAGGEAFHGGERPDPLAGFLQVDGQHLPVVDHYPAIDNDRADTGAGLVIHQQAGTVKGLEMGVVKIDKDQVGWRPGGQCAQARRQTQGSGAAMGGHGQQAGGRHHGGVAGIDLVDFAGKVHLPEQIQAVVGGGGIGAEGHPQAPGEHGGQRRPPRGQLGVGLRAGDHRGAMGGEQIEVMVIDPDTVHADCVPVEQIQGGQVGDG